MSLALSVVATFALLGGLFYWMATASLETARRTWLVAFTVMFGAAATMMAAHAFVAKWGFRGDSPTHGLVALMDGTAERPFVYRRLAPSLVRMATDRLLPHASQRVTDYIQHESPLARYRTNYEGEIVTWTPRTAIAFHIAYLLTWLALFGTFLAGAALNRTLRRCSWLEASTTACLVMSVVPLMFTAGGFIYDAPELFLWTALLLCAVNGRVWAVAPLFALMLVNKESALLAVPALFPILLRRCGLPRAAAWTVLLGAMGCVWQLFVHAKYAALPGQPVAWFLPTNLAFWARPSNYFRVGQLLSPGLPSPRGANVVVLILLFLPFRFGWRFVRRDVQQATIIMGLILVPVYLVSGYIDEVRALALWFPLLLVAVVEGVHRMFGAPAKASAA